MTARFLAEQAPARLQPLLIRSLFESACSRASTEEIVDRNGERFSYPMFADRVRKTARGMQSLGVTEGSVVGVLDWDSVRYLEMYFAIPMIGAVLQMVNPRLPIEHLTAVLRDGRPSVMMCHEDFRPLLAASTGGATPFNTLVTLSDNALRCEYEAMIAGSAAKYDFPELDENTVATLFHTSGTTGLPKAVSYTHRQLVLQTISTIAALGMQPSHQNLRADDVYMPLTPMFHVHAWGLPFVATVMGLKQVYPGKYEPHRIISLHDDEGVTFSHCVPTVLQMILAHPGAKRNFGGWRMIIGGSALPASLHEAALQRGIFSFAGYGMSETGPLVSIAREPAVEVASGVAAPSVALQAGYAVPLVEVRIADEHGRELPRDGVARGELQIRSPWLTKSYVGNDGATDELWAGGWLHTQDVATIAPDGCITICDRLKDLVKSGGEWISPAAIEEILMSEPSVAAAAVVAANDERWGERPVAFVMARPERSVDVAELATLIESAAAAGRISRYGVPGTITLLDALPLTSVGKIDKVALRKRANGH